MDITMKQNLLLLLSLTYYVTPTYALDLSDVDTKYYYIVGGAVGGGILVLIILICCCVKCNRSNRTEQQTKSSHQARRNVEVGPPLPIVHTESEQMQRRPSVEYRRRLELILSNQAAAASRDHPHVQYLISSENGSGIRTTEIPVRLFTDIPTHYPQDPNNIITSFERIKPLQTQPSITKSERRPAHIQSPDKEVLEFEGIKLKPIPLNKSGGTYIPPEDF